MISSENFGYIESFKIYGKAIGLSFQLIDDYLDYMGSPSKMGKNIGDDFKEGKVTLPIILAYLRSDDLEKKFWKKTINNLNQKKEDFSKAVTIIKKYNCIEDTIERARHFANVALDSLGPFDNNKYKLSLINLIKSSISRLN